MIKNSFFIIFFVFILALSRIIPHPPNFTPILASAIMAPLLIKDRWFGIAIPIFAMFISDIIIGFHNYQFVIYSTILTIGLVTPMNKNYALLGFMVLASSVWFFVVTNFAVWILWDFYPKTINGLISCYILALPFFKNTLISTFLFTGIMTVIIKYLTSTNEKVSFFINNFINKFSNNLK